MELAFPRDPAAEALLAELERRVTATPAVATEHERARSTWPHDASDPRARLRFREWFLLERSADSLGAPPAVAWAPREIGPEDEDPWARLLGSHYGIHRVDAAEAGALHLTDLATGRALRLAPAPDLPPGTLLFGRSIPDAAGGQSLLPGWRIASGGVLADAFAADLAAARAAMPRARVSQLEIERLWAAAQETAEADREAAAQLPTVPVLIRALPSLLTEAPPEWNAERALAVLEEEGAEGLLERLAFETEVPLEPIRAWLTDLRGAVSREEAAAQEPARAPERDPRDLPLADCDPEEVRAALAAFDRERAMGSDFGTAWSHLLSALQLANESDEPDLFDDRAGGEPIGPPSLPGLSFWVEAWAWEAAQGATPPRPSQVAAARSFTQFVEALHEGPTDAAEIGASDLWAFLSGSPDAASLEDRKRDLDPFLRWLRQEQGADLPLEEMLAAESPRGRRLTASVTVNAALADRRAAAVQSVRLARVQPMRVQTETQEEAPVVGFPAEAERWARTGDALVGRWEGGVFRAAGWFPSEFSRAGRGEDLEEE